MVSINRVQLAILLVFYVWSGGNASAVQDGVLSFDPFRPMEGDSKSAVSILTELDRISTEEERPPSLGEFRQLLLSPECSLSSGDSEYWRIYSKFVAMQEPKLDLDGIRLVRNAVRDSIESLEASWELESLNPGAPQYAAGKFRFVMDGLKFLYEQRHGKNLDSLLTTESRSFDGQYETVFTGTSLHRQAIVHDLSAVRNYFSWHHPLWFSMQLDSKKFLGSSSAGLENFDDRNAFPLSGLVEFNGLKCVVLLEQEDTYFLDPSRNYAFCGLEAGRYIYDEQIGRLVETDNYRTVVLDEFRDLGNSLWLPTRYVDFRHSAGIKITNATIRVEDITVNKPVDSSVFSSIVPDGVEIVSNRDGQSRTYIAGEIEDSLDAAVPAPSGSILRTVLLAGNAVIFAILVVVMLMKSRAKQAV